MILRYELVSLVISDQIWTEQSHLFQKPKRNTMLKGKGVSALLQDCARKNPDYRRDGQQPLPVDRCCGGVSEITSAVNPVEIRGDVHLVASPASASFLLHSCAACAGQRVSAKKQQMSRNHPYARSLAECFDLHAEEAAGRWEVDVCCITAALRSAFQAVKNTSREYYLKSHK